MFFFVFLFFVFFDNGNDYPCIHKLGSYLGPHGKKYNKISQTYQCHDE